MEAGPGTAAATTWIVRGGGQPRPPRTIDAGTSRRRRDRPRGRSTWHPAAGSRSAPADDPRGPGGFLRDGRRLSRPRATRRTASTERLRRYLEKHSESFKTTPVEDLCKHALQALAGCVAGEKELDAASASLAVISADGTSRIIEDGAVQKYLDTVEVDKAAAQTESMAVDDAGGDGDVAM